MRDTEKWTHKIINRTMESVEWIVNGDDSIGYWNARLLLPWILG